MRILLAARYSALSMPKPPGPPSKPWSMKWIALAIILFMAGYTVVTLQYRKPNKAYEPFNDMKERGQTRNLLTAGYQRIPVRIDRPTNPHRHESTVDAKTIPGDIPHTLRESLFDQPAMADSYEQLNAPEHANTLMPYILSVQSITADLKHQITAAFVYVRGDRIFIIPEIEKLEGGLLTRRRDNTMRLIIPGGAFKPGDYQVTLAGAKSSLTWALQVH